MVPPGHHLTSRGAPTGVGRWLPIVAWVSFAVLVVALLARAGRFGYDEAQYAIGARRWITGNPDDLYPAHRSLGMIALVAPGVLAGGGEVAMRLPFVGFAVMFAVLVWRFTRRQWGAPAGALALVVTTTAPPWCWRATEVLSDIPAAVCLLAAVMLIVSDGEAARPRPGRWACVAALLAIALVVRYGAASSVAATGLGALVAYPRRWRWLIGTGLGILVLLTPVLAWSSATTGSPLGIWYAGAKMGQRAYLGEGLAFYVTHWPTTLAGPVAGATAALGLGVGLTAWRPGRGTTTSGRIRRMLVVIALVQILAMGLLFHGEGRFLFFPIAALVMNGCGWIGEAGPRVIRGVAAIAVAAIIPLGVGAYVAVASVADQGRGLATAAAAIRADAGQRRCIVFTGSSPQLGWYTGCRGEYIDEWMATDPAIARGFERVYLATIAGLRRQVSNPVALSTPALSWRELARGEDPQWSVYIGDRP